MTAPTTIKTAALGSKFVPDEVAIARLRRVVNLHFGDLPLLDAHLALLDSRGVLYATHAAEHWADQSAALFFGMVRHVIRTQCNGPAPDPDIESWLAAGRPSELAVAWAWDLTYAARYPSAPLPTMLRGTTTDPVVTRMDQILLDWPDHITTFIGAYCQIEAYIDLNEIQIPPISI